MTAAFVGLPSADFPSHLAAKYRPEFKGLQKVADDLGVPMVVHLPKRPEDAKSRYFIHGTTTGAWQGSAVTIPPRAKLDFGRGFYLYKDLQACRTAAAERALQTYYRRAGIQFVLRLKVSEEDFGSLKVVDFGRGTLTEVYGQVVNGFRNGDTSGISDEVMGADIIIGPTARQRVTVGDYDEDEWEANAHLPVQYCFRSVEAVAKLVPVSVFPCDVMYEQMARRNKR